MGHSVTGQMLQIRRPQLSKVKKKGLSEDLQQQLQQLARKVGNQQLRLMFTGEGKGDKALAADLLADGCGKDLAMVDVTAVISKYIGETERNLAGLLGGINQNEPVVFLDYADALFEDRSELLDGDERFVNQMVEHLLSRLEDYPGVIILASNYEDRFDAAIRNRFVKTLDFPTAGRETKGGWLRTVIPWPKRK